MMVKDMNGLPIVEDCRIVKAEVRGRSAFLTIRTVREVTEDGKVYLDGSHQPVWYPERLMVLTYPESYIYIGEEDDDE
jgi:hypothetical protein